MSEKIDIKDSLTWGEVSQRSKFKVDPSLQDENGESIAPITQLASHARNNIIRIVAEGVNTNNRLSEDFKASYNKALELDENVGSYQNWVSQVLPNEVDKKKELDLFKTLDLNLNETDGSLPQEFKKSIDDPSYISPDLVQAQDKFNELKQTAIRKDRTSETDPENSPSLPFVSIKDSFGNDTVSLKGANNLKTTYTSLEEAIKESIDRGALKPRDLLTLSSQLKFAEGTEKTYSDLQREFDLIVKVTDYAQEVSNKALQEQAQTGQSIWVENFGKKAEAVKALNALSLDVRSEDLFQYKTTEDPETASIVDKIPKFIKTPITIGAALVRGQTAALQIAQGGTSPLRFTTPFTDLEEPLGFAVGRLTEDDLKFINNKTAIAKILRKEFELDNLSDDQVIESVRDALGAGLHASGQLFYVKEPKKLFLNIKKKENFGTTVHPKLFLNDDNFEKAIKQHPDLTTKDIEILNDRKKIFWESQSESLLGLISQNEGVEKKWRKTLEKNNSLKPEKQKILPELLKGFFNDEENFSYVVDNFRHFGLSLKESLPVLWHGVLGMLGNENSVNKGIELQLKKEERRALSSAFGGGGFFFDLAGVGGDLVPDLGLTFVGMSPASAAAKKIAVGAATKKLAAKGYKITKLKGTSNALYSAFFASDTAAKTKIAADLLKSGVVAPLKTKKYSNDIVKVLSDDLASLALKKTDKLTNLGALAFGVGAPAGLRSASYSYFSYMDSLPDNLSFEEKRERALPLALLRGGITAAITVGASYLGRGGVEAFAAKKPSKLLQLRGYKPVKNALENLAKIARATDKAGKSLLVSEVAEIAAAIARQGLRRSMLFGLGVKTVGGDLLKVGIDEGIEEGLDEFIGSFVDEFGTGNKTTMEDKLGAFAYAGLLGLSMGVGVSGAAKLTGTARAKLGLADTTEATETAYKQLVDMVMDQATTLNEAATNARNAQAPLTAEVLEQNRNQLLAGVAKDPVAPAASFRMSVTRDTNISEDRDPNEIVTVNADEVVGVAETTNEQGETIFAVEYSPADASGQVLTAFTKNASVARLNVRTRENYKIEQDIIQEIKDEVLIPNVDDQNEALRTAEGVEAAANNFISKHEVALRNNNIKVLIDPTEEQQQGFIDLVEDNEAYEILQGAESSVQMNSEGEVFIIINTANTSEVTNSIPKQRRTTYMQSVFTEALASSFELVSTRDKYFNIDPEARGDLSLEEFVRVDRLTIFEEMSQYERDWAASLILGEDVEEGLSEKVSDKSLIASTHINSLLQLDMSGQVKGVQKTAWSGKSRGGALSKNVKQKLYDILSYLRAAVRTATTTASRDFLRGHINYISDNLTKPFFDAVANLSDADQARIIDGVKDTEAEISSELVNPIEDSPLVGSLPQASLETVPKEIKISGTGRSKGSGAIPKKKKKYDPSNRKPVSEHLKRAADKELPLEERLRRKERALRNSKERGIELTEAEQKIVSDLDEEISANNLVVDNSFIAVGKEYSKQNAEVDFTSESEAYEDMRLTDDEHEVIVEVSEPAIFKDGKLVGGKFLPKVKVVLFPKKQSAKPSALPQAEVEGLNFADVEQPTSSDTVIGRNEDGDLVVFQSMTLAEAEIHLSNLEKLKGQFIDPSTPVKIFISPNSTPNTDANTQVILQTQVKSSSFSLNSVQGSPDSPSLRQAILENPLFSRNMVESDLDGDNILYKMEEDPDRPSSINLYAVPKVLRFTRELTQEDINALNEQTAAGVDFQNFSEGTTREIQRNVLGDELIEFIQSLSEEAKGEIDLNTELSSGTATEDYIEPVQQTSVEGTDTDTEDPPKANNKQKENDLKVAKKIYSSLQRRLLREGTRYYEGVREGNAVAWYDKAKRMIGINPSLIPSLLRDNNRLAAKAIMNLAVDEELIHQISWETLTYNERKKAIQELLNADRRGANALIMMVQEYNTKIRGYSPDEAIQILRLGLPESDSLPAGIEDTPANRVTRDEVAEYIFEELIRKHVSLVNGRGAVETDYTFLQQKENQGVKKVYMKYIENFFVGRLKAKKALRKDSKLGPYYATAVAKVAQEFKAAREGFRRRPDYDKLDLDIDLGVYSKQSTLIGTDISTVAPEDEQREEWLSEIDPQEIKKSVVKGRTVGTRSPSAKGKAGEGVDPNKVVTLKDLRENPEAYKKNALILLNYPIVAREFKANPLLEKVRKAKAPVNKAELKKQQLRQDLKSAKTTLKNDLITYKVNERSDELKPQRKQEADDLKKQYTDSEAAVKQIEKEVTKLNNSLKRAKKRLRETISKENKKVNALIKKAQARGNQADLEVLQQRKADIKNILSNDVKTAELIEGINNNIADAKQRLATIKKLSNANKRSFEKALKEFSKPTVKRTSIKVSASQVVDTIEQFESDIAEGTPVRVGAKSLVVKLNAIKKKEKELESAVKDATNKTSKFGDSLKKLSQSERAFPIETADEIFASLNDVAQKNLSLLIKLFPQDLRVYASLWYDGANIIANKFAKTFDISVEQAAAVLAVFSPQKDWYMNVALAERTMHIFKARQSALFDASMSSNFLRRGGEPELKYDKNGNPFYEGNALPVYDEDGNHVTDENGVLQFDNWNNEKAKDKFELTKKILSLGLAGKRFNEIEAISFTHKGKQKNFSKEALQARFIRMFSEAAENEALRDPKTFNVIRPDGAILERPSMSEKGAPRSIAWGSYVTIEKAIRVLNEGQENPMDVVSNELGLMHKVRSFYNNIVDPSSRAGHVTMDTHAIAALLLKPVSGNSIEVTQNFGGQGTASDSNLGISGLYPAFAEAYRSVSFTNDTTDSEYLVREIQSITWEAVRMLFPSKWKANKNHVRAIEELHAKYEEGIITLEQLQEQIYSFVQTSQAKGMPADEALSISEGIQSANTVRGLGVGRPDWGQATPVRVEAPPSEQEQFTSIRWRNLETRHAELAALSPEEMVQREKEIADLFRTASRKAEEIIPDYFSYEFPVSLHSNVTEERYIYKNPKGADLERDANLKENGKHFILTPANKYMFSPNMTAEEAANALGLNEYIVIAEYESDITPDKVDIHILSKTTEPYVVLPIDWRADAMAGVAYSIIKDFYGDDVADISYRSYNVMGDTYLQTTTEAQPSDRFVYDRAGLVPLSIRFAPKSDVDYKPLEVKDSIKDFGALDQRRRDPYDIELRRSEWPMDFVVPIEKGMVSNIGSVLTDLVNYRNPDGEASSMVPIAKFLLGSMSDYMLRWRVYNDPNNPRSNSSPDPAIGINLGRWFGMRVPKDFPNAERTREKTSKKKLSRWLLDKFDSPVDIITKWKGIKDGLIWDNKNYRDLPDVVDYGKYNDLSPEDKSILNDWIKWNYAEYELDLFDSEKIELNLKNNPELEKYIDYETIGRFLKYNQFYSETKSGKAYKADKTTLGSTFYKAQGTVPTTIIHEIFHALTQREFDKHITKKKLHGKQLYDLYKLKSKDQSLPEPIREILRVYLKAVDYGDKYLQYRPLNLPNSTRLIKPTKRSRNITKLMSTNPDKAGDKQFYGLANIDEFCTMSIMSPEFQQWLRTIPDPEALTSKGKIKSLWDKFTKLITDLLNSLSKPLEGELSGLTLFDSSVKSIMEVAAMSGDIDRSMFEDNPVDSWKTIKGASAAKAEAETLRKGKKEEFIEKNGLNLPPINREILSGVYKYEPEEASGTTSTATVATYEKLYDFIENKAYGKSLQEFLADYNVLDWGSGRGGGSEKLKQMIAEGGRYGDWRAKQRIKLESYEPFFVEGKGRTAPSLKRKPRKETQDLIINSQVVNVIPADERAQLLQDIYASLKEEGQAIITTRTPSEITKSISKKTLKVVGPAEYISYVDGKATTYQKGFSAKSLKKFIEEVLPEADVVANGLDIGPTHVVITKPKGAGIELDSDPEESIQYSKITSNTYYHGTSKAAATSILKDGIDQSKSEKGYFGRGFYAAYDKELAQSNYADFAEEEGLTDKGGDIIEFSIPQTANILDLRNEKDFDTYSNLKYRGVPVTDLVGQDNFHEIMTEVGVDGLIDRSFEGIVIYNESVINIQKSASEDFKKELDQFTKIRGEESFPEMFSAKQEATQEADEAIKKASFGMDVERIMALFGPKMYDAKLSKVLVKESAQNSYDALKDLFEIDPTLKPEIEYGVWAYGSSEIDKKRAWNWGQTIKEKKYGEVAVPEELIEDTIKSLEKGDAFGDSQWFYVRDNGIGMNPEIINNAFFTLGGSYKQSKKSSGGFGLAKIQMLHSAEEVFIKTVRNGVQTTVRVDHETLMQQKDFDMVTTEVPEGTPSGTQVWLKYPKEIDNQAVELRQYEYLPDENIYDGNFEIKINNDGEQSSTLNINSFDQDHGFEKTVVKTPTANVTIRALKIGKYDKDGNKIYSLSSKESPWGKPYDNNTIKIFSNGLLQFEKKTPKLEPNDYFGDNLPYHFIVDIDSNADTSSLDYPFNNNREGFSSQWTGKKATDATHPIQKVIDDVVNKYRQEYRDLTFSQEFDIIRGIDGADPKPSVPVVYNNMNFDLDSSELSLMNDLSKIIFDISDDLLDVYKHDYFNNDNSLRSRNYVERALKNNQKADHESDPSKNDRAISYHYGAALSKNWGGVNTSKEPNLILVNPVYSSTLFDKEGDIRSDIGIDGFADYITDIIFHEVNHVSQNNENAGFTYAFSAIKGYKSMLDPIFENSRQRISELIQNNYDTIKAIRQKFVKGSTKFLDAEIQGNGFIDSVNESDDVRGREVRSQREAIEENFGKSFPHDEIQITDRGITLLEAFSKRTFKEDQVKDDPPVQDTQIRVQPTEDWTLYAGKQVGGLYISSDAIENGYSVLEKPANQEKKRKFEEAKVRLATYLEEERTQAELDGQVHVPFSYDVVSIEKDQVRFVLMSDLTEAHPHVVESLRVPNDPEKPVQEGRTGNAIYHRMEQILGFKHPLYQYHKTITDLEEGLGLLNLKDDDGKKVFPSGSERVWKQQVESTGYRYDSLKEEHRKIKQKFFGDPQDTIIGQEDITQTPEYIESSEAWDTLIDILRADIKVIEEDPDDVAGPIPNPVKFLQRKIYGKDAEMDWRKGGTFWSLFYGPYERTLRKYKNKSSFFKKAIQDVVLSYKSTTDRLLKEIYTDNGLDIPSRTIFEATGTTQFAPSEEVAQAIQDRYLDKVDEINKDSSLEGDAKKEALLEAYNEREAEKQLAARDVLVAARKRKSEALEKLRQDSPELAKHIISLRKLAGSISSEIGNMVSLASPELQLKIDERQDIYLTTQYRMFTRPNWTEEFLELDIHRTARDLALDYFAGEYVRTQTEHLVREGGLDKETAEAQALDNLKNKPELKMMALENFLRSYDKDFGVDSLKRKANLPAALRGALGEFSEETNMDVLYRTLLNLGTLISKMSLKDKLVSQGIKSGWLVTQEKAALERKRAEDAGRPDPYEDYVEVVKSKDSTISEELAGSLDDTGVQVKGEGFEVKLNPDGTVKETPRSKPPTSDPLIDYRVRTEDGSVERKGNLLARPDVKQAIIQVLNPKQGMSTPDNEYIEVALKLFGGIEKSVAGLTGLGMLSKTLGSIPFYERQILGSFLFLSQNGIPISGYIPALFGKDGEIGRSVLPSGVFKKRSYLEGRSADRGDMAYYASLKSMGVLDEGIVYSILKDLLSGNISKEDVELEIDHLKHPTKSILKKSKLFAEGSTSEKALRKAAELMKVAGKVKDIPIGKAQALALALDNAIKVQAYEYERSWLLDAREDSQTADRADEYRDLSNAELDEMAAQIVLRTQQSRSQSAPIVEFFNLPVLRIVTAPFARFLAENPRLLVNIMRQSSAEMNSSNPVIKERGSQRNKGFLFTNFVLYMALPMFLQRFVAGLGDDEERVLRKSAPEFSRFQNLFYLKDSEGEIGTVSLSYVHPMSPILDFAMRGFEHTMRGDIKEAIETVTVGYLFDTFLNDQIFWSAISDVKDNLDRDTGRKIVGEYSPDALKTKLTYILEKGLAPPTLIAASKSIKAIGTDYPTGEGTRTFLGYPLYSPQGQALRHLVPVKFYPLQLESMARRRFREIYDNMYFDLQNKNKLRRELAGFDSPDIDKIIRREFESLSSALKDARLAYKVYSDLIGSEGKVRNIMKESRFKKTLVGVVGRGYLRSNDLLIEGESLIDDLKKQGLGSRAYQLYQAYRKLINEQPMIPLD